MRILFSGRAMRKNTAVSDLLAARSQMAFSLGFHIVFAAIAIALPVMMVVAECRWHRTGEPVYLDLAKRWAKGTAILFAVGAVSGTVLSFELGLLWPRFMELAGPLIGVPFSLEGFAFFTEAIFIGVYLYGWDRIPFRMHVMAGVFVAVSGAAGTVFVIMVNAWMNTPVGFESVGGHFVRIDPVEAMRSPAAFPQSLHMLLAAYASTGLAVAGMHAWLLRRHPSSAFHRHALTIAFCVGAPAALIQPLSGDLSARLVARTQPVKLAAMEGQFGTERGAPLRLGGWPDEASRTTRGAIEIPRGLSLLAFHSADAEVKGLTDFPQDEWPPVRVVHLAFQIMTALGSIMAVVSAWGAWTWWHTGTLARQRLLLLALALVAPLGFVATEAGWIVTEVGRQPWIVQGVLRTADAVTPMPGLWIPFGVFVLLYLGLAGVVVALIARLVGETMPGTP
jgi:cytochrome d ubiquinol oxidase subunit I